MGTSRFVRSRLFLTLETDPVRAGSTPGGHLPPHFPSLLGAVLRRRWRIESTEVGRARNPPSGFIYGPPSDKNLIAY